MHLRALSDALSYIFTGPWLFSKVFVPWQTENVQPPLETSGMIIKVYRTASKHWSSPYKYKCKFRLLKILRSKELINVIFKFSWFQNSINIWTAILYEVIWIHCAPKIDVLGDWGFHSSRGYVLGHQDIVTVLGVHIYFSSFIAQLLLVPKSVFIYGSFSVPIWILVVRLATLLYFLFLVRHRQTRQSASRT